jgi:hypothetical protein
MCKNSVAEEKISGITKICTVVVVVVVVEICTDPEFYAL